LVQPVGIAGPEPKVIFAQLWAGTNAIGSWVAAPPAMPAIAADFKNVLDSRPSLAFGYDALRPTIRSEEIETSRAYAPGGLFWCSRRLRLAIAVPMEETNRADPRRRDMNAMDSKCRVPEFTDKRMERKLKGESVINEILPCIPLCGLSAIGEILNHRRIKKRC